MSKEKTITVDGYFGEKQMTVQEFTKEWREHAGQLLRLDYSDEWTREVTGIAGKVIARAIKVFDETYAEQNKDAA